MFREKDVRSMGTVLVSEPISVSRLREIGEELYGDMVKAVVDVKKDVMAVGAELHADEEAFLLARNSQQEDLWGINIYTDRTSMDMIEFDSMINIRPRQQNRSRYVEDPQLRADIIQIVHKLVTL